jgi:hypothetical protein
MDQTSLFEKDENILSIVGGGGGAFFEYDTQIISFVT